MDDCTRPEVDEHRTLPELRRLRDLAEQLGFTEDATHWRSLIAEREAA